MSALAVDRRLSVFKAHTNAGVVPILGEIDTARIRRKIRTSQSRFVAYIGVSQAEIARWHLLERISVRRILKQGGPKCGRSPFPQKEIAQSDWRVS
jgi:hypothetical protein